MNLGLLGFSRAAPIPARRIAVFAHTPASFTATSTAAPIGFTADEYDYGGMHDEIDVNKYTRFYAPVPGVYHVAASACYATGTGDRLIYLVKNGDTTINIGAERQGATSSFLLELHMSATIFLNSGDYLELYIFSSVSLAVSGNTKRTFFSMALIQP